MKPSGASVIIVVSATVAIVAARVVYDEHVVDIAWYWLSPVAMHRSVRAEISPAMPGG
jgi:hypothetical protein